MSAADRAITVIAERQFGVFSRAQARSAGLSRAGIKRRIDGGVWRRLHAGVYGVAGATLGFESRAMAAVLAAGGDACASHATAAVILGLDVFRTRLPMEVMIFDRRGTRIPGVVVHRPRLVVDGDRTLVNGIPTTSVARTFFDIAQRVPLPTLEASFDDALRRRLVSLGEVASRLRAVNVPGVRGTRRIARLLAERSSNPLLESELETVFSKLIAKAGLPSPVPQYEVRRPDGGLIARVDFAYPTARLAIELDGYAFHSARRDWQRDRTRQNELITAGWTPLRFTKDDLGSRHRSVISDVTRCLLHSHSGHTRGPS